MLAAFSQNSKLNICFPVVTMFLGLAAMEVDFAVLILYLVIILIAFVGFGGYQFYKSRTGMLLLLLG